MLILQKIYKVLMDRCPDCNSKIRIFKLEIAQNGYSFFSNCRCNNDHKVIYLNFDEIWHLLNKNDDIMTVYSDPTRLTYGLNNRIKKNGLKLIDNLNIFKGLNKNE